MLLREIRDYLKAVIGHGVLRLTGGVFALFFLVLGALPANLIPAWVPRFCFLSVGFFVIFVLSPFLAWRDQYRKVAAAENPHSVHVFHSFDSVDDHLLADNKNVIRVSIWANVDLYHSLLQIELSGTYLWARTSFLGAGEDATNKVFLAGRMEGSHLVILRLKEFPIGPKITLLVDICSETPLTVLSVKNLEPIPSR